MGSGVGEDAFVLGAVERLVGAVAVFMGFGRVVTVWAWASRRCVYAS